MEIWDTHLDISDLVNLVLLNEQKSQTTEVEDKKQYEIPQLDRRESYRIWLHELYKTRNSLAADAINNATMQEHGKLLELLKLVITELELKLTSADSFSSSNSEFRFWSSVQAMAHGCAFSFFDLMKVCTFPGANSTGYTSDFSIPGLVDHAAPCSLEEEYTSIPLLDQQMMSLPCPLQESSTFLYPLAFDNAVNSQKAGLQASFSAGNTALCMPLTDQTMAVAVTVAECAENDDCSRRKFPAVLPGKCKRRIQRQRRRLASYNHLLTNFNISACSLSWPSSRPLNPLNSNRGVGTELQFLLQKELKPSDVGSLGRIILPKRQAEEKLPHLDAKEGVIIAFEDLQSSQIWNLRFRFWPNNKTRMYLLECTGNFVKSHHLQKGDFIVLYRNPFTGNYMISGMKMDKREMPGVASEEALLDTNSGLNLVNCATTVHDEPLLVEKEGLDDQVKILQSSTSTDVVDLDDPYDLMKGISTFEADGRSIDEIFNFD